MNVFNLVGTFAVRGVEEAEADIRSATRTAERGFTDMASSAKKAADDVEDVGRDSTEAGEDVERFGKKAKKAGEDAEDGFKKADMAFASFAGNLGANLLSSGLNLLTEGVGRLIDTASDAQEDFGKLSVAFDKAGYSAETASSVYYDFVGLLGETDQSVEAANHLAKLCKSEEELAQWSNIAAGVFAEFGDSLPLEGLTEAAKRFSGRSKRGEPIKGVRALPVLTVKT